MAKSMRQDATDWTFPRLPFLLCIVLAGGMTACTKHDGAVSRNATNTPPAKTAGALADGRKIPEPAEPVMLEADGVRFEDDPLVRRFLGLGVRCHTIGGSTDEVATVMDLMRLRVLGYASPPFEYEVRRLDERSHDFIIVRERVKSRKGGDIPGAPGFVAHKYVLDDARARFEHVQSSPENPAFDPEILSALGNPIGFLAVNSGAVCNGRWALRARSPRPTSDGAPSPGVERQSTSDAAAPSNVPALIAAYNDLDDTCRSEPGGSPASDNACGARSSLGLELEEAGMCRGREGEVGYQRDWHRCGPRSCRQGTGC